MKCGKIKKYLSGYLDNEITDPFKKEIEEHLRECQDCQKELENLKETVNLVGSLNRVEVPLEPDLSHRIRDRLARRQPTLLPRPAPYGTGPRYVPLKGWAVVAAVIVILLVGTLYFIGQPPIVLSPEVSSLGLVSLVQGNPEVLQGADTTQWVPAQKDMIIGEGDIIRTSKGEMIDINLDLRSALRLKENSELIIQKLIINRKTLARDFRLNLNKGELLAKVNPLFPDCRFAVYTPTTVTIVKGTSFTVTFTPEQTTKVCVSEGVVEVANRDKPVSPITVSQYEKTIVYPHETPDSIEPLESSELKSLKEIEKIKMDENFVEKTKMNKKLYLISGKRVKPEEKISPEKPKKEESGHIRFWEEIK